MSYIVIGNIKVAGAKVKSGLGVGLPSISVYDGFLAYLMRDENVGEFDVDGFAVIIHSSHLRSQRDDYGTVYSTNQRMPSRLTGGSQSENIIWKSDLELTIIVKTDDYPDPTEIKDYLDMFDGNLSGGMVESVGDVTLTDDNPMRSVKGGGHVIIDRTELLAPYDDKLHGMVDLLAQHKEEGMKDSWVKRHPGWLMALSNGFYKVDDINVTDMIGLRDGTCKNMFVSPVMTIVEAVSPRRFYDDERLDEIFWSKNFNEDLFIFNNLKEV